MCYVGEKQKCETRERKQKERKKWRVYEAFLSSPSAVNPGNESKIARESARESGEGEA